MFGVVDESGILQSGQVFVRYTRNIGNKLPGPTAERIVLQGPILLTKNPCIVEGDIRMYEAVDVPALHHLCDVLVFPRYGPRPHSDEMAGSDLDGDEYTVIWDDQLYLQRNEKPFDYTSLTEEVKAENEEQFRREMANFFVNYIKQDSIGRIANAFLVNSDLYGITSEVCKRIANKHMEAVDFPKTGIAPPPLNPKWDDNVPPERSERVPDYMEKNHEPSYISHRLNGQLFRRIKTIDDILSLASDEERDVTVPADPLIMAALKNEPDQRKKDQYYDTAKKDYEAYSAMLQSLIDSYGIGSEGELFSGCFMTLKNRLSDKDNDDMSFYNTQSVIEGRLAEIFGQFRKRFFESYGGQYEMLTTTTGRHSMHSDAKEIFRRHCQEPGEQLKKLASAYYTVSYANPNRGFLSFPWVAWDVILKVRQQYASSFPEIRYSFDPLSEKITEHAEKYLKNEDRRKKFVKFVQKIAKYNTLSFHEQKAYEVLYKYCQRHQGLDELLFFCVRWAMKKKLLNSGQVEEIHICLLLLLFGSNGLPCESVEPISAFIEEIESPSNNHLAVNLKEQTGGIGKKFLCFLEFLASRAFRQMRQLDFRCFGCHMALLNNEWLTLHSAAVDTYNRLAFSSRFDELPSTEQQLTDYGYLTNTLLPEIEGDPFVIEVPKTYLKVLYKDTTNEALRRVTGCSYIVFRPLQLYAQDLPTVRVSVSMTGTVRAINNLKNALMVTPNLTPGVDGRKATLQLTTQVIEKITSYV